MEIELQPESDPEQSQTPLVFARAQFADRFFAYIVDGIIVNTPLRLASAALAVLVPSIYAPLVVFLLSLLVYFWYFAYFAFKNKGQTLGKKWLKIRIVQLNGEDLTLGRFVLRELARSGCTLFFGMYGLFWLLTYLLALTKKRLALHDILVKTQVIKVTNTGEPVYAD